MSLSVNEIALKACRALLPFDRDKAHDLVCDLLDDYCLAGEFVPAADFLARLSATDDLPVSILVTALTITLPWREQLAGERAEVAGAGGGAW